MPAINITVTDISEDVLTPVMEIVSVSYLSAGENDNFNYILVDPSDHQNWFDISFDGGDIFTVAWSVGNTLLIDFLNTQRETNPLAELLIEYRVSTLESPADQPPGQERYTASSKRDSFVINFQACEISWDQEIELNELVIGQSLELDGTSTCGPVTYTPGDTAILQVVVVDDVSTVTAVGGGTTTLTATADGPEGCFTAAMPVSFNVTIPDPTLVIIDDDSQMKATVTQSHTYKYDYFADPNPWEEKRIRLQGNGVTGDVTGSLDPVVTSTFEWSVDSIGEVRIFNPTDAALTIENTDLNTNPKEVFFRLKSDLEPGVVISNTFKFTGGGVVNPPSVTLTGTVTNPDPSVFEFSDTSVTGLGYEENQGPGPEKPFFLTGSNIPSTATVNFGGVHNSFTIKHNGQLVVTSTDISVTDLVGYNSTTGVLNHQLDVQARAGLLSTDGFTEMTHAGALNCTLTVPILGSMNKQGIQRNIQFEANVFPKPDDVTLCISPGETQDINLNLDGKTADIVILIDLSGSMKAGGGEIKDRENNDFPGEYSRITQVKKLLIKFFDEIQDGINAGRISEDDYQFRIISFSGGNHLQQNRLLCKAEEYKTGGTGYTKNRIAYKGQDLITEAKKYLSNLGDEVPIPWNGKDLNGMPEGAFQAPGTARMLAIYRGRSTFGWENNIEHLKETVNSLRPGGDTPALEGLELVEHAFDTTKDVFGIDGTSSGQLRLRSTSTKSVLMICDGEPEDLHAGIDGRQSRESDAAAASGVVDDPFGETQVTGFNSSGPDGYVADRGHKGVKNKHEDRIFLSRYVPVIDNIRNKIPGQAINIYPILLGNELNPYTDKSCDVGQTVEDRPLGLLDCCQTNIVSDNNTWSIQDAEKVDTITTKNTPQTKSFSISPKTGASIMLDIGRYGQGISLPEDNGPIIRDTKILVKGAMHLHQFRRFNDISSKRKSSVQFLYLDTVESVHTKTARFKDGNDVAKYGIRKQTDEKSGKTPCSLSDAEALQQLMLFVSPFQGRIEYIISNVSDVNLRIPLEDSFTYSTYVKTAAGDQFITGSQDPIKTAIPSLLLISDETHLKLNKNTEVKLMFAVIPKCPIYDENNSTGNYAMSNLMIETSFNLTETKREDDNSFFAKKVNLTVMTGLNVNTNGSDRCNVQVASYNGAPIDSSAGDIIVPIKSKPLNLTGNDKDKTCI
jgi:hypothetical protein